jgi:putative heme-binding domain-containing protein
MRLVEVPLCRATDDAAGTSELLDSAGIDLSRKQIADLVGRDIELAERSDPEAAEMRGAILEKLAASGETPAIEYVRGVFETDVELRDEAAYAISLFCLHHRKTPGDWRFLVRSLMVVEGPQAESVLEALVQFRQRATKPIWIRQVILLGLTLPPDGMASANRLLEHWSDHDAGDAAGSPEEQLAAWQAWFREEFPDEADSALPPPHNGALWTAAELREHLLSADLSGHDVSAGAEVFRRAGCAKCHRFGSVGEQRAPELTRVRARLQRKQVLDAMLYPSLHLNEEYPAATVLLKDGRVFTGTVAARGPDLILLVTLAGSQHQFEKDDIEKVRSGNVSGMPSGLLDDLSEHDILDLFAFLLGPPAE